jgi:hypothetical protein
MADAITIQPTVQPNITPVGTLAPAQSNAAPVGTLASSNPAVSTPTTTDPSQVVGTSTNYRAAIGDLGNNINTAKSTNPVANLFGGADTSALTDAYKGYQTDTQNYQNQLAARKDAAIKGINSEFDTLKTDTQRAQTNETGAQSASLARIGGYLGDSASGNGVLLNLENRHRQELQTIEQKRAAAINEAQTAFEDNNFKVAQQAYQEAKDLQSQIYARQKDFADFSLQYQQFQNTKDQQQLAKQQAAQEFALKYKIPANKPFYSIGGTVYRTADQKAATSPQDYAAMGGKGDFSDVYALTGNIAAEQDMVASMAKDYPDAGISANDTLATATQKLKTSQLYQAKAAGKIIKYTDSNGNEQLYDPSTGRDVTPDGSTPTTVPGYAQPKAGGWRTDNNNNPIAAAISTNSSGNEYTKALDAAGIPWEKGDPFSDNPGMSTIKILGDPIEGARAILSNSNAIQNWYVDHTGKSILGQMGVKNSADFKKLSPDDQNKVIASIYKAEVGTGELLAKSPATQDMVQGSNSGAVGTTGSPDIDTTKSGYATTVLSNTGGLTQAALDQQALDYALSGTLPAGSRATKGPAFQQQKAIKNRAAEMNVGGNIAANKENLKALSKSLTEQTSYLNTVQRSVKNAEDGFTQLTKAFQDKGLNPSESRYQNQKLNDIKNLFGNNTEARYAFDAGLTEVANEYSNVFSRGGQVSDSVRNRAASIMDGSMSLKDLLAVQKELQSQGQIVINGSQYQVQKIQDQINSIINPGKARQSNSSSSGTSPKSGSADDLNNINFFK